MSEPIPPIPYEPGQGGSYRIDPDTGAVDLVERTEDPVEEPQPFVDTPQE